MNRTNCFANFTREIGPTMMNYNKNESYICYMPDLNKIYLFRMMHIDNMSHVLANGITHKTSALANPTFAAIGDTSIISRRSSFTLPNGKKIGDYIPFYFWVRMPMLYVIQNGFSGVKSTKASDIVYCVTNVQEIIDHKLGFVFSDGHGIDSFTTFYAEKDIIEIDTLLDFTAIKCKYWNNEKDLDFKRKKEAEFLVEKDIPITAVKKYIVCNKKAKEKLLATGIKDELIIINSDYYF